MTAEFHGIGIESPATNVLAFPGCEPLELGSLVAALAEETEDEFELDLRLRDFIESGRVCLVHRVSTREREAVGRLPLGRALGADAPNPGN